MDDDNINDDNDNGADDSNNENNNMEISSSRSNSSRNNDTEIRHNMDDKNNTEFTFLHLLFQHHWFYKKKCILS